MYRLFEKNWYYFVTWPFLVEIILNLNSMHKKQLKILRLMFKRLFFSSPIDWDCRIHKPHLCRGVRPSPPPANECYVYDMKQSDDETPVMLKLWRMRCIPSLPSLPSPLWPGVVASKRVLSMGQIKLFNI